MLLITAIVSAVISQAGMALVVRLGGTYRPVTIKSTALIVVLSIMTIVLSGIYYELFGRKGIGCYVISLFCIAVTVQSFLNPVTGNYYRYPSLAAILAVNLAALPIILGKHGRKKLTDKTNLFSEENIFAAAALAFGMILAVNIPVSSYNSWDDENHYERVLYMSQGIYATETEADIDLIYSPFISIGSNEQAEFENRLNIEEENPGRVLAYNSAKAFFPDRIGYLGILALTWLGRMLGLSFSTRYILGRIGNLLLYVVIMYFAIRHLKRGKTLLACVALVPTAVFLSANYSADPWVLSLSALSFSYFFRANDETDKKLEWREIIIMVGAMVLAVLPKLPYAFLLVFLLLMPRDRFEDKKQMIKYWVLIIACGLMLFAYLYMTSFGSGDIGDIRDQTETVSGIGQIQFILSDVNAFIQMTGRFMLDYINPVNIANAMCSFGFLTGTIGAIPILAVVLLAAIIDGPTSKTYIRILGIVIILLMVVILGWVFYLVFTPVGKDYIMGCQPRYIIPLVMPLASLVLGGYVRNKNRWVKTLPVLASVALLAINVIKVAL